MYCTVQYNIGREIREITEKFPKFITGKGYVNVKAQIRIRIEVEVLRLYERLKIGL